MRLAKIIDENELRTELDHVQTLRFNNPELHYLRGTNEYQKRMFKESYLEFLKDLQLPDYHLEYKDGDLLLEFAGPWSEVIYWETHALPIINGLYYRSLMKELTKFERKVVYAQGRIRLMEKIKKLKELKSEKLIVEFGTRRRFSREWQDEIVQTSAEEIPEILAGTSNTFLAMKYGLIPMALISSFKT